MAYPIWLLKLLQASLILLFGPLSGVALSLSGWVTPAIMRPENTTRSEIAQFDETITRGMRYLQPSTRLCGLVVLLVTLLVSQHPEPSESWKWQLYGAIILAVTFISWYEIYFIFPINDTIQAMGDKLESTRVKTLSEAEQKKLNALLLKWEFRHRMRIAVPFFGCAVALLAIMI